MTGTRSLVVPVRPAGDRDLAQEILTLLATHPSLATAEVFPQVPEREVKAAIDKLASRSMIAFDTHEKDSVFLTDEAAAICETGSHEYRVWEAVKRRGRLPIREVPVRTYIEAYGEGNGDIGQVIGKSNNVVSEVAN